jgi:hypothetical protein
VTLPPETSGIAVFAAEGADLAASLAGERDAGSFFAFLEPARDESAAEPDV